MNPSLIEELRRLPLFASLTDDQIYCLEGAREQRLAPGEIAAKEGDPAEYFSVLIEGELRITRQYGKQEILMATHKQPGAFSGEISLLLGVPNQATIRALKASRLALFDAASFWRLLGACPSVTGVILRTMATRIRNVEGFSQQREKLISLGTMALPGP